MMMSACDKQPAQGMHAGILRGEHACHMHAGVMQEADLQCLYELENTTTDHSQHAGHDEHSTVGTGI